MAPRRKDHANGLYQQIKGKRAAVAEPEDQPMPEKTGGDGGKTEDGPDLHRIDSVQRTAEKQREIGGGNNVAEAGQAINQQQFPCFAHRPLGLLMLCGCCGLISDKVVCGAQQ